MSKVHFERQSSTFLLNTDFKQIIDKQEDLGTPEGCVLQIFCSEGYHKKCERPPKTPT